MGTGQPAAARSPKIGKGKRAMAAEQRATIQGLRRREERLAWLFVTPVVLGMLIFQLYPTLFSLYVSFTEWNLLTPMRWVGWRNFTDVVTSDRLFPVALT